MVHKLHIIYWVILFINLLLSSSLLLFKKVPVYLKIFPVGFLVIIGSEFIAEYLEAKYQNNHIVYNFSNVITFIFFSLILYLVTRKPLLKKIIFYIGCLYPVFAIAYICLRNMFVLQMPVYITGSVLLVVYCLSLLYDFIGKKHIQKPLYEPAFWILCGILVFEGVTLPIFAANEFGRLFTATIIKAFMTVLYGIYYLGSILFAIAFLLQYKIIRR